MPIDLYSSIKKTSQWAFGSPLLNGVLGSSLFVAVVIALIMMLLIMFLYPAKPGTSFSVVFKMFVYMFFSSLLVIFLHDGVIKYMMEEDLTSKDSEDFMRNTTMQGRLSDPSYAQMYKPIQPTIQTPATHNDRSIIQTTPTVVTRPETETKVVENPVTDTIMGGGYLGGTKPNRGNLNPYS